MKRIIEEPLAKTQGHILPEHYYLPGEPERRIQGFATDSNGKRYREGPNNLTPEGTFTGQHGAELKQHDAIKRETIVLRKKLYAEWRVA